MPKNPLQAAFLPTFILTNIGGVAIDAILSDTTEFPNLITKHPVEKGFTRADNIVKQPIRMSMTGKLTDTPSLNVGGISLPIDGLPANIVNDFSTIGGGAALASFNALRGLRDTQATFTVVSDLGTFENMAFSNLSALRAGGDGFGFTFSSVIEELLTVSSDTVLAADVSEDAQASAAPEQSFGFQGAVLAI